MPEKADPQITRLLDDLRDGQAEAEAKLIRLVYRDLRRIAGGLMKGERAGQTLQPTALVHDAFIRLRPHLVCTANRRHLFAVVRQAMRRLLIDRARSRRARLRAGERLPAPEPSPPLPSDPWSFELVTLLEELATLSPRWQQVVEYRFLVGLTEEQTAQQLDISRSQVQKDWRCARAWLYRKLQEPN